MSDPAPRDELETREFAQLQRLRQALADAEVRYQRSARYVVRGDGTVRRNLALEAAEKLVACDAIKARITGQEKVVAAARADYPRRAAERKQAEEIEAGVAKLDREEAKLRERLVALEADAKEKRAKAASHRQAALHRVPA